MSERKVMMEGGGFMRPSINFSTDILFRLNFDPNEIKFKFVFFVQLFGKFKFCWRFLRSLMKFFIWFVHLFIYPSIWIFYIYLPTYLFIYLSTYLCVHPFIHPKIQSPSTMHPSIYLSMYSFTQPPFNHPSRHYH